MRRLDFLPFLGCKALNKTKVLKPIEPKDAWSYELARELKVVFKRGIYDELLAASKAPFTNASDDALISAVRSGRIRFLKGQFSGEFNAAISKELRDMGAVFDARSKIWKVPISNLTPEVQAAISAAARSVVILQTVMDTVLDAVTGKVRMLTDLLPLDSIFDKTTGKIDQAFKSTVLKEMSVQPKLSGQDAIRFDERYVKSVTRPIKKVLKKESQINIDKSTNKFADEEVARLRDEISKWVKSGKSREGLQDMIQARLSASADRAKFIARQETSLYTSQFKQSQYEAAGIKRYIWDAVLDSRTRPQHRHLDGEKFSWDNSPIIDLKTQERGHPGEAFGCVIGPTSIGFYSNVKKSFKRFYQGPIVKVTDESGVEVSITPNHPILTLRGWVFAKDLDSSDKLLKSLFSNKSMIFNREIDHSHVSLADEIHNFLSIILPNERVLCTNDEFHGDMTHHEVNVISVDSELPFDLKPRVNEKLKDFVLALSNARSSSCKSDSGFTDLSGGLLNASSSIVRFLGLVDPSGNVHAGPLEFLRFRFVSYMDSAFDKSSADDVSRRAKLLGDLILTHKFDRIKADDLLNIQVFAVPGSDAAFFGTGIISIDHSDYSGDVFNFETDSGTYIANEILISNCRCVARPIVEFD